MVESVTQPPKAIQLTAQLVGGTVCNELFAVTGGITGTAVAYKSHATVTHEVWMSHNFLCENLVMANSLIDIISRPQCKWKLFQPDKLSDFAARAAKLKASRKYTVAIAFVTRPEQAMDRLADVKLKLTFNDALVWFNDLDPCRTFSGATGIGST